MRILLILLILVAAFALVQSHRHNCTFGEAGWFDCVLGRTATPTTTETPAPAPETPTPSETPPATQP